MHISKAKQASSRGRCGLLELEETLTHTQTQETFGNEICQFPRTFRVKTTNKVCYLIRWFGLGLVLGPALVWSCLMLFDLV